MIPHHFYENREALDREFSSPHFDPTTGLAPEILAENLKQIFDERFDRAPTATVRAELFAYLYDNVQIEINPQNLFAAKINHQRMLTKYTSLFKERILSQCSPETLILQKEAIEWGCIPYIDYHHTLPNWNDIQRLGFAGLLSRAQSRKEALSKDPEATEDQLVFIDSVVTVYEAILRLMRRFRDESRKYPEAALFTECITELLEHEPRTTPTKP